MNWRTTAQARRALTAGLLFFIAAQGLFNVVADSYHPGLHDPEYAVRLALLHARLSETPNRPLLLMMGSSRTVMCFRPENLAELHTSEGAQVLPFNFSHLAAGPLFNLMEYRRLRAAGVRPKWLIMEVMPSGLGQEAPAPAISCANAYDLPLLSRYVEPAKLYGRFTLLRLIPWHRHRNDIVHGYAPALATPGTVTDEETIHLGPLGGDMDWQVRTTASAEWIKRGTDVARFDYQPRLQQFQICETPTRIYRELIELCRADGVQLLLLIAPESSEFRSWYTADALRQLDAWCADTCSSGGPTLIDARTWLPDGDFVDSHHVLSAGADRFTKRLEQEVLRPLVER